MIGPLGDAGSPTYFLPNGCGKKHNFWSWIDLGSNPISTIGLSWQLLDLFEPPFLICKMEIKNLSYRVVVRIKQDDVCKESSTMHTLHIRGTWYMFVFFFNLPTGFWGYLLFFYPVPPWVCRVSITSHANRKLFSLSLTLCVRGEKSFHMKCRIPLGASSLK